MCRSIPARTGKGAPCHLPYAAPLDKFCVIVIATFIPEYLFAEVAQDWILWVIAVGATGLLVFGADRLVSAAVRLSAAAGLSTVIIGATVVSLGTTSPEAFVSVTAAFAGEPGLALANGIGSVICDTALVFGICLLIRRLPLDRYLLHRQGVVYLATGGLLAGTLCVLALLNGGLTGVVIPRIVGVVYVSLLVVYLYISVRWARRHPDMVPDEAKIAVDTTHKARLAGKNIVMLVVGLAMVILGSNILIGSVTQLCTRYGVPPHVLGATLVAFETSLPELVTALTAIARGHPGLMIGNIIGADILNVLFVIGASACARPLNVPKAFFFLHVPVMLAAVGLMGIYTFTSGKSFRRWQGVPLLALYVGYYVTLFIWFR